VFDSPYRRVAVAIDGSPASDAAIRLAFTVVCAGGEVAFLHATDRAATIAHYVAPWKSDIGALESMELFERGLFESALSGLVRSASHRRATQSKLYRASHR